MKICHFNALVVISILNLEHVNVELIDIIGGSESDIRQFPYQVSLRLNNDFFCGGIIIDAQNILTAAHCVCAIDYSECPVSASDLSIVAGSTTLYPVAEGGIQIPIEKIFVHEHYISKIIYANDIAVLRLSQRLKFGSNIHSYPLADSTPPEGTECIATGWGKTSITGNISNTLKHVNMSIIGHNSCAAINNIFYKVLCTERGAKKPYKGDSGGALKCDGKIAGIVSSGSSFEIFPNFYTDIAQYKSWIDIQLERDISTSVIFNFRYYIYVLVSSFIYSALRRNLFIITIPFIMYYRIIRRILRWIIL